MTTEVGRSSITYYVETPDVPIDSMDMEQAFNLLLNRMDRDVLASEEVSVKLYGFEITYPYEHITMYGEARLKKALMKFGNDLKDMNEKLESFKLL